MYEGGRLLQFAPSGELLAEVAVPVRCPTMPCFGGDDLKTLFVTSARHSPLARGAAGAAAGRLRDGHAGGRAGPAGQFRQRLISKRSSPRPGAAGAYHAGMDPILDPLIDRIRAAADSGTPLRIRGGGSKDFYGERLQGELLETAPLAGITSYEPTELVVTARAGTPLAAAGGGAGRARPVPAVRAAALRRRCHRRRHGGRRA